MSNYKYSLLKDHHNLLEDGCTKGDRENHRGELVLTSMFVYMVCSQCGEQITFVKEGH